MKPKVKGVPAGQEALVTKRKDGRDKRDRRFVICLTAAEYRQLKNAADVEHTDATEYARQTIIKKIYA